MEKQRLLDLFSQDMQESMKDKSLHSCSYMMAGKYVHVLLISDDEKVMNRFIVDHLQTPFEVVSSLSVRDLTSFKTE